MAYSRGGMKGGDEFIHGLSPEWHAEAVRRTKDMMMREGLTEQQAERAANRLTRREVFRGIADMAMYGMILPVTWRFRIFARWVWRKGAR